MSTKPPAPPAPAPTAAKGGPRTTVPTSIALSLSSGVVAGADRIMLYGSGGIGKTTLAAFLPGPLFLDLEGGSRRLNVTRDSATSWRELRGKLAAIESSPPTGVRTVVIDSASIAEELAKDHVVATRLTEKGKAVASIEEFGWGKGWQFVFDEFNGLLADLDRIVARGLNVCLVAHVVDTPAPNPFGEDWIRYEPHLYDGDKTGRGSVRARAFNWADHVLFVGYDVDVRDGKGRGAGTRTIYTQELPTHVAKTRATPTTLPFEITDPGAVWRALGIS